VDQISVSVISLVPVIALLISLGFIVYKYGQTVERFEGIKRDVDNRIKLLEREYNTAKQIQALELKFAKDLAMLNTELKVLKEDKEIGEFKGKVANEFEGVSLRMSQLDGKLQKQLQIHLEGHAPRSGGGIV
jgi:hypothetical protein